MNSALEIRLIREIEIDPQLSQRELSSKCEVSLGSIHYCLNALINRGYVKAKNFKTSNNKIAYAYILTPAGLAHKRKITVNFLKKKHQEFEQIKREIALLEGELNQVEKKHEPSE